MPTDGADFARRRAAYRDVFVKIKNGASEREITESLVHGLRRDILLDGNAPVFKPLAILLADVTGPQLFSDADKRTQLEQQIRRLEFQFADASLCRHFAAAALSVGVAAIDAGRTLSSEEAGAQILWGLAQGTCLDCASNYAVKYRCGSVTQAMRFFETVQRAAEESGALCELGREMLASSNGAPNRPKRSKVKVEYTADALSNHIVSAV